MTHTPEQQWSALSALYEEADGLPADELPAWLARLEQAGHPLLPQLRRMLEARAHVATDDFLGTLPRLSSEGHEASTWSAGRRIGPYRLVRPLGEGGMAEVWLAERDDGAFKRQVAIKLPYPRPGRETFALRFDRERDILATLRHPHIAGLFDAGVTKEGQAWLALEYVEGQPISTFCDQQKLPVRERVKLFRQVLLAVQHAHANLVIHRDLKPANILVTPEGEVRLLDFGIAKLLDAGADAIEETELTRQAGRSMTPRYASPEQLTGLPLTTACDVYSLGVVFYELMCGERPYELKTESPAQLEHAILEVEPRAPSRRSLTDAEAQARGTSVKALRRVLSPELDAIALRCLAKKATARYSSVDAVLADVDRWLAGEAVLARAPGAWYRLGKFAARHRIGVGLGATAVVALAVSAAVAVVFAIQAREESARAVAARDFMLGLFKRADQEKSRGADITARELLESGHRDLLTRLASQPRLQAELLHGIATIQRDMGEYVGADSTFAHAAQIYAQLGMPRDAALARSWQADAAVRMGDIKLAQTALQQAKDTPNRPRADPELNALMSEVEGWIAVIRGEMDQARGLFHVSHGEALKAVGPNHPMTMRALRGRVYVEQRLRNFVGAMELMHVLETTANRLEGIGARETSALAIDRAELLRSAGQHGELYAHLLEKLSQCIADLGPKNSDCKELLFRKIEAMLRLGMTSSALEDLPALEALANDRTSPMLGADASILILKLQLATGGAIQQIASLERVRSIVESGVGIARSITIKSRLTLAEASLRARAPGEAERWLRDTLAPPPDGDGIMPRTVPGAFAKSLQGIALLQRGQAADALASLLEAHSDLSILEGPKHSTTQFYALNVAIALEALGRSKEALAVVDRAEPVLRKAMGADAPMYRRVVHLQNRLRQAVVLEVAPRGDVRHPELGSNANKQSSIDFFTQ